MAMHPNLAKFIDKPIPAQAETADFGPAYKGEEYVTMTSLSHRTEPQTDRRTP